MTPEVGLGLRSELAWKLGFALGDGWRMDGIAHGKRLPGQAPAPECHGRRRARHFVAALVY